MRHVIIKLSNDKEKNLKAIRIIRILNVRFLSETLEPRKPSRQIHLNYQKNKPTENPIGDKIISLYF
jgi:hypothetical protein